MSIRKASIHHHFRTKTDLALALVEAYDARYDAALAAIVAAQPDAIARIEAYGRHYLTGVEDGLGCLCAVLAIERDTLPDALRAELARFFDKHIAWLEQVLAEGCADGSLRPGLDPARHGPDGGGDPGGRAHAGAAARWIGRLPPHPGGVVRQSQASTDRVRKRPFIAGR